MEIKPKNNNSTTDILGADWGVTDDDIIFTLPFLSLAPDGLCGWMGNQERVKAGK